MECGWSVWVGCVGGVCVWSVWVECVECVGGVCGWSVWSVKCEDRSFGV